MNKERAITGLEMTASVLVFVAMSVYMYYKYGFEIVKSGCLANGYRIVIDSPVVVRRWFQIRDDISLSSNQFNATPDSLFGKCTMIYHGHPPCDPEKVQCPPNTHVLGEE